MPLTRNPRLEERMNLAQQILGEQFKDFEHLVKKFNARLDYPEWDILCFHILTTVISKKKRKDQWYKFWSKNRQPIKFGNFTYSIPASYYNFGSSKESSHYFLELLHYYKKKRLTLSWDVFLQIFFDYRSKIMPKFNKMEFQVFQAILQNQTMSNTILLKHLPIDTSNLSKYKRRLKDRYLIFEGLSLNYSVLSLSSYAIVYDIPLSSTIDFFKELPDSPFLHSIYSSYSNSQSIMIQYIVPDNPLVKSDLLKLCEKINAKNKIISSEIFRFDTSTRLKSFNFTNYDYKKAQWDFPYYKILSALTNRQLEQDEDISFIISEFPQPQEKILNLNKIGIDILNYILMTKEMSINTIKDKLDLSEKLVKKHVDNFQKHHYFKSRINPNYVFGLSNLVLFLKRDPSEQLQIHKQLSIFPELYSQKFSNEEEEGIHFIIRVPREIIFDCMSIFNSFYKRDIKEMFVINQMYSRRWSLPSEKYETVFHEWKYESKDILGATE
ncbi:MAG: hypothetical protein ACTSUR_00580 [Candidatus Heimdallarchaeaceae archaeon]